MVSYSVGMESVFKALADDTRRALLDELFEQDGQTLNGLADRFDMTRVAVAKHLGLLEAAGLVVARRRGREKFHYLNSIPIQMLYDRWVSKYTGNWAAGLAALKDDLEHETEPRLVDDAEKMVEKVFEIYIRTTPERLWQAITDPETRARYQFGARVESDWKAGSSYKLLHANASRPLIEGENLEVEPPHRLVQSHRAQWDDDMTAEGTTRVTWEIEQVGDSCRLVVTHDNLRVNADSHLYGGWPMILSGLKTWLETGQELTTPGSLAYQPQ